MIESNESNQKLCLSFFAVFKMRVVYVEFERIRQMTRNETNMQSVDSSDRGKGEWSVSKQTTTHHSSLKFHQLRSNRHLRQLHQPPLLAR